MRKLSLITIAFILISIISYGFFMLVLKNLSYYLSLLEERVEIVAFINDTLNNEQKSELIKIIENIDYIDKIKYTSKEQALEELKKNQDFSKQIKILAENPLPATIDIYLRKKDPETIKSVAEQIKPLYGIEEIYYTSIEAENLLAINKNFKNFSNWASWIFFLFYIISLIAVSMTSNGKNVIYGLIDGAIGGGIGFYILYLINKHLFVHNFNNQLFFSKSEIILISVILLIVGMIVRIPKNVLEKKEIIEQ
ncbi:MAG: hypothetical protein A2539_07195 [Elusimicrobia bacterium RIFOXYD2_FULL_34_15]|nr:MAG: hypothetical protein A2539_07195 [Elusimicrobia bacterium RIFOXYD2_FULL_34_15]